MQFTYRNPERSTTPRRIIDAAESIVVGAWPYEWVAPGVNTDRPHAQIAAYAWRDHYAALKQALGQIAEHLTNNDWSARVARR